MSYIKEFFSQIGSMINDLLNKLTTNEIIKKLIIAVFIFILLIIFIALFASCSKKTLSYHNYEKKMLTLAKQKFANNKDGLPKNDKDFITLSLQSFIDSKQLKDTQSIIQNHSVCTGYVKIINNNNNYLYIPYLDCGKDYKTPTLYNTLTNNTTTSGNGLYKINNEYIFKGDVVNNYLTLNGIKYLILRINEDGTIRLLDTTKREMVKWDDRFNVEKNTTYGINDYIHNGINSRIKDYVENIYDNTSVFKNSYKPYFATTNICIGKRSINDDIHDNNIECSNVIGKFPFTLLSVSEYYDITLDNNCNSIDNNSCENYNYLSNIGSTWTITADKDSSFKVYKLNNGIFLSNASYSSYVRLVTTINGDLVLQRTYDSKSNKYVSGDGSSDNPYVIETFN